MEDSINQGKTCFFTVEIISLSFVIGVIPFLKSLRESTKDSFFLGADSKAKGDGRLVNGNKSAENDTGGHD